MKASVLIDAIENFAPLALAEPNDPTGLQIGDTTRDVHKVMTTLDVRPETVAEAIEMNVDFIWAHHPVMFRPAKNLDLADPQNQLYAELLTRGIVVYASHTNLDATVGGMNDWLAECFGIQNAKPLCPNPDGCSGLGRIGTLAEPQTATALAQHIQKTCGVAAVRVITRRPNAEIRTLAVLGGDGGRYWREAQAAGADAYVTADVYYHVGHDVLAHNFTVIDPDHHMEALANQKMAELVWQWQLAAGWDLDYINVTHANTDPYRYVLAED